MELTNFIDFAIFLVLLGLFLFIIFSQTLSMLHRVYIFLHLAFMHWALLQFASQATNILELKFLLVQTSYLVFSTISVIFYVFSIYIINKTSIFKSWKFKASLIPAFLLFFLVLFNPKELFIREYSGPAANKVIGQGPLFNTLTVVSFMYVALVLIILITAYVKLKSATTMKRHISFTLIGIGIIVLFSIIDLIYNIILVDYINGYFPLISLGFLFSACYMTFRINRNNVLNIISLAHRDVINTMSVGILIIDLDKYIVEMNRHIDKMIGLKVGDILDYNYIMEKFPFNNYESILKLYDKQRNNPNIVISHELVVSRKPDRFINIQCHPIVDRTDSLLGYMYTVHDVTEMKSLVNSTKLQNSLLQQRNAELIRTQEELYEANKKLEKISITDPLTGCYNRRYLIDLLERQLATNVEEGIPFSVIVLDIDYFKSINDRYGHLAGDYVLKYTAEKLQACLDSTDVIARFGGEEFIIYFYNVNREEAQHKINKIKEEIETNEIRLEDLDQTVTVTISIGIVSIDQFDRFKGKAPKTLQYDIMALADQALYDAKNLGRNTIVKKEFTVVDK